MRKRNENQEVFAIVSKISENSTNVSDDGIVGSNMNRKLLDENVQLISTIMVGSSDIKTPRSK